MARQPIRKPYAGSSSRERLEGDINFQEQPLKKVTKIEVDGSFTVCTHDRKPPAPPEDSLKLLLDPNSDVKGPNGEEPFVRGEALISNVKTKVALVRLQPAQAGAAPPASPAVSSPPPAPIPGTAPAPATDEDTGTGPEGNPNLNPDGTPRTGSTGGDAT